MKSPLVPRWARKIYLRSNKFLHRLFPNENALLLALAFVVGVGSGLGAMAFQKVIHFFEGLATLLRDWQVLESLPGMGNLIALVLGGLAGGILIHTIARSAKGHGVPDVMYSVALRGGRVKARVATDTALASGVCIGSGGSAGPEGPIVQIGSSIGSFVGKSMRMSSDRLRILTACGAAGGISAIFGAPLAGVMFAVEVILGDFSARSLTAIVVASVLAASTHQAFVSWQPLFDVPNHEVLPLDNIPLVLILGVLAAFLSTGFTKFLYRTESLFNNLSIPPLLKPASGMLLVGIIALWLPDVLGHGYSSIEDVLQGRVALQIMALTVLAKLVATCFTVGSGNVGGLFAPSLVIGAMLGGAFGAAAGLLWPGHAASPVIFTLIGMAALVAGTTHATISSILLVFELTGDYSLILPLMLGSAVSVVLGTWLNSDSIYALSLVRKGIRLKRGVEVNILAGMKVRGVMRTPEQVIPRDLHFNALLDQVLDSNHNAFSVVDKKHKLVGMLTYSDVRSLLLKERTEEMNMLIVAEDLARPVPEVLIPTDNLLDAMRLYGIRDLSMLPVVNNKEDMKLIGALYRIDVLNAYRRALMTQERRQ